MFPSQVGSSIREEEGSLGVEESLCQGLESSYISIKLLKEELLTGFPAREGFFPRCEPIITILYIFFIFSSRNYQK